MVGVDVGLDDLVVLHQHQAVAHAVQEGAQVIGVLVVVTGADELGAVAEGDLTGLEGGEVSLFLLDGSGLAALGHGDAPQLVQHTLQDDNKAHAACVHHACLLQDGVHVGGLSQGLLSLEDGGLQHVLKGGVFLGCTACPVACHAGDGEDGALCGLHDCLVGGDDACVQTVGQVDAVYGILVLQGLGEAAEDEGEDDAGVAPGTPEHGRGIHGNGLTHGGGVLLLELSGCGADGQAHVGAGVAVGHGEDVELVDLLLFCIQGGGGMDDHPCQRCAVNELYHNVYSFSISRSAWSPRRHPRPGLPRRSSG